MLPLPWVNMHRIILCALRSKQLLWLALLRRTYVVVAAAVAVVVVVVVVVV